MRNVVPRGTDVRVAVLAAVIGAIAVLIPVLVFPAALDVVLLRSVAPLNWAMLTILFTATEACAIRFRFRRRPVAISLTAVPMALGLFLGTPGSMLIARGLAALMVSLAWRRLPPARVALRVALALAGVSAATLTLHALLAGGDPARPFGWFAGVLGVTLGGLLEAIVLLQVAVRDDPAQAGRRPRVLAGTALTWSVAGAAAVTTTVVCATGQGVRPAALIGVIALVGYRAFAKLAYRHASLERLYVLSDRLAAAPGSIDVVRSVLQQSATLLRADYAEVMLAGADGVQLWSVRAGGPVYGPVEPGAHHRTLPFPPAQPRVVRGGGRPEREFLLARAIREAAVVPLRINGPVTGQLLVADRLGEEGGFAVADLRLLETVANHASVALRNGRLIDQLHFEARHDELTGLPNRLYFRGLLEEAAQMLARGVPCAVLMIDFDGFKAINDSLGHAAGDRLLQVLAGRFHRALAGHATVARLGGDEFAVLASGVDGRTPAMVVADRLLAAFDEPVEVGGTRLRVGGSLGIALGPQHGRTGGELLRMADVAMYVAKSGGGGARLYSPELAPQSSEVLTLATDLRDALLNDEIEILVQPLVRLDTLAVHSMEALARWRHPVLGEIAPGEFFAAAERSGLTAALSQRVLDCALQACRRWQQQGYELTVNVNMATRWLHNTALPGQVAGALERHGVPAEMLCLEITESSVMDDPARCLEVLGALRSMGVRLSVDDFGAGYSSLTYLSRLPVDQLKIDPAFVQLASSGGRDQAVVRSIIDLGRNLGLEVVAEGITDAATRRTLAELGCQLGQGFLFSRPIPTEEVPALLERIRSVGWPLSPRPAEAPSLDRAAPAPKLDSRGIGLPAVTPHLDRVAGWPSQQPQQPLPSRRI